MSDLTPDSDTHLSVKVVPEHVAELLLALDGLLRAQYGCDFAYTVMANGHCIAASNAKDGHVQPRTTIDWPAR